MPELDLRNDVYRRPLQTALERLGLGPGWSCADIGAGGGDVTVALAAVVGHEGRVYAVDIDPSRRDEVAQAAAEAGEAQVVAITQAAEDLVLPERVDLAYCRFLLMHVVDPLVVLRRMASITRRRGVAPGSGTDHVSRACRWRGDVDAFRPPPGHWGLAAGVGAGRRPRTGRRLGRGSGWRRAGPVAEYLEDLTGVGPAPTPWSCPRWSPSWPVGQPAAERGQSP